MLPAEILCVLAGTLPLVAGFTQAGLLPAAIGWLMVGLIWLVSLWRQWTWVISLCLFALVVAAGVGIWAGLSPILMVASVLGSLFAWDLANFSRHLQSAAPEDDLRKFQRNHFLVLIGLGIASVSLSLTAISLHLHISFGWMLILALAAFLGIMQLVTRFRRGG